MRVPEPEADGLRRYRQWAGSPNGTREDITRCVAKVPEERTPLFNQCRRKRGHGEGGLYCKQHAKSHSR